MARKLHKSEIFKAVKDQCVRIKREAKSTFVQGSYTILYIRAFEFDKYLHLIWSGVA